jgi:hypothetical protein
MRPDDDHPRDAEQARRRLRRTGTVVLATTLQRERLIASTAQLTPESRGRPS